MFIKTDKNCILIAHNFTKNSFSAMSYGLAYYFASKGKKVIFISHKPHFEKAIKCKVDGGEIYVYSWPTEERPTKLRDASWFLKIFLKHRPSITLGHFVGVNIVSIVSKLLATKNVKCYAYYHTLSYQMNIDNGINKYKLFRKKYIYKLFCDIIIPVSKIADQDVRRTYGLRNTYVVINPMLDRLSENNVINTDQKSIIISYLGRLDLSKGVILLLDAFKQYREENPNTKIKIRIAGGGKLSDKIANDVQDSGNIVFVGSLKYEQVDEYLRSSTFTIIPSLADNLVTVGIESMMNATPILLSRNTGLADYVEDGEQGFLFHPTVDGILQTFRRVEDSFNSIDIMKNNARKKYLELFTMEHYYKKMEKLFFG
jgi:glycosyltransferase involved in cell wall biosynthesis